MKILNKCRVIKGKKIQNKFFFYFIVFMLIPVLILGGGIGTILLTDQMESRKKSLMTTMEKNSQQLNKVLREALQIGQTVSEDKEILDALNDDLAFRRRKTTEQDISINNSLMKISSYFDENIQVYILSQSGSKYKSSPLSFQKEDFQGEDWYQRILSGDPQIWFDLYEESYVMKSLKKHYISVGIPMGIKTTGTLLGVLLVEVCVDEILFQNLEAYGRGVVFLYNPNTKLSIEDGTVKQYEDEKISLLTEETRLGLNKKAYDQALAVAGGIPYWETTFPDKGFYSHQNYEIAYEKIPVNDWILVNGIPRREFYRAFYVSAVNYLGIFGVLILLAFYISRRAAHNVTRPILELKESAESVQKGNFQVQIVKTSEDEIGELSEQFNKMVADIRKLMGEILEEQEVRRNYELMLLNAQINPHFLYNTLDSLMWLIRIKKLDDAETMLQALTNFFKTGLNKGKDIITLKEETENVSSYLAIQKLRYKSKLRYEIFLDPEMEQVKLPKLILQPLVENSIYHGIKPKEEGGVIFVWCFFQDGSLLLRVKDNGVGMEAEELKSLQEDIFSMRVDQRDSYGLVNVNERLHLFFRERYTLEMESRKGMGTEITIRIKGEDEYV